MNDVLETGAEQTDSLGVEKAAAILGEKVEMHWLPFELNADMPVDGLDRCRTALKCRKSAF
jgi:hypothetical protein